MTFEAVVIVSVSDPLYLFIVKHGIGSDFIGSYDCLVGIGLELSLDSSINHGHVSPSDDEGVLGNEVRGADHSFPEVEEKSVTEGRVLFFGDVDDLQVHATLGNFGNVLKSEPGRNDRRVLLNEWVSGRIGQFEGKLVGKQSLIEGQVAVALNVDVVELEAEEGQSKRERLVVNWLTRSDVRKIGHIIVVH